MKEIKLNSGLVLNIDEEAMNDMELLDDLAQLDEGNGLAIPRVCDRLLGKEKEKLYESIRENGRVKVTDTVEAMKEILSKLGDAGKN